MADRATGELMMQSSYFYIGHFARFIRPGARRVLCAATRQALECTAFVNPDGQLAVVVMNRSEASQAFALRTGSGFHHAELPARSIATYLDGGATGLVMLDHLMQTAPAYLKPGGLWLVEVMAGQATIVAEQLEKQSHYDRIQIHRDLDQIDRFVSARKTLKKP
jgi:hypothetical protein